MPPQPGLFPVSYGATHIQSQSGIAAASSSSVQIGPGIIGPGIAGKPSKGAFGFPVGSVDGPGGGLNGEQYHHVINGHQQQSHPVHGHGHGGHPAHLHHSQGVAGPSRVHGNIDDGRKEKKRKDVATKLGKEMSDRRDDGRHYTESISVLHNSAHILATRPDTSNMFRLRLYPLSLERSSLLAQLEIEETYAIECARVAYDEERERVEEEWKRGRERVKERLMEGIEERRKRAREEKEGEGTVGDASLDSHSRPPITRKLRNKLGTSPPPTPLAGSIALPNGNGSATVALNGSNGNLAITTGPFLNPHSLAVDEIPSPFPLPLTSTTIPNSNATTSSTTVTNGGTGTTGPTGRRKPKGNGGNQNHLLLNGFGKSLAIFNVIKESEVENDLGEIRRGNKRRRATAAATAAKSGL